MSFQRRILHHGSTPTGTPVILSLEAVKKCWFELNRQGGCGSGEITLSNEFFDRAKVEIGDWISFESTSDERWYLGRVEERQSSSPAQTRLRLEGMSIELNEVFPGGFGEMADGKKPHRYAGADLFSHDPDRLLETFDSVGSATELITKLIEQYVVPATHITFEASGLETPLEQAAVSSLKVRGEESIRSLLKDLSIRSQGASWGVDEMGGFYFKQLSDAAVGVFQEGVDLSSLSEIRDREHLFNRILLTGDYIYDRREASDMIARRSYRWRGNFVEPISRAAHGEKRIRIWLPWVRTQNDSLAFAREFFRTYSQPLNRYLIETTSMQTLPRPWAGRFAVYDQAGELLTYSYAETVRVLFDHVPRMRMELGPLDPRELWAEPPQDERWELPDQLLSAGGEVPLPSSLSIGDPPPPPEPPQPPLPPPGTSFAPELSSQSSNMQSSELYSSALSSELYSSSYSSSEASIANSGDDSTAESGNSSQNDTNGSINGTSSFNESAAESSQIPSESDTADSSMSSEVSTLSGSSEIESSFPSESAATSLGESQSSTSFFSGGQSSQLVSSEEISSLNGSDETLNTESASEASSGPAESSAATESCQSDVSLGSDLSTIEPVLTSSLPNSEWATLSGNNLSEPEPGWSSENESSFTSYLASE